MRLHGWVLSVVSLPCVVWLLVSDVRAGEFASSVTNYSEGTFATVGGTHYTNPAGAIGKPSPIVGAGSAFAGILSPFNAHYETDDLTAIGRGGSITLQFPQAMSVSGSPQIGVFTKVAFLDMEYPNGGTGAIATTDSSAEFGAERTAVVEVASHSGDFHSLGRVIFDDPTNYYANAAGPYAFPAPDPAALASFDKPFAGSPGDFDNKNFAGVLSVLNGSAGGTWVSIPANLGLADVQYLRLSDPLWRLPNGTLETDRQSVYYPAPNTFTKPADLFVDGAVLIPEPTTLGLFVSWIFTVRKRSTVTRASGPCE